MGIVYVDVVGAENFGLRRDKEVDFDFNILTAFIRLGRAGPVGAGCPPILYGLGRVPSILLFDFNQPCTLIPY
jgi:hypothetical protein